MVAFLASNPRLCMAALSSLGSIVPARAGRGAGGQRREHKRAASHKNPARDVRNFCRRRSRQHAPEPSVSKRLKASRISSISSSVRPGRSVTFAFEPRPDCAAKGKWKVMCVRRERKQDASNVLAVQDGARRVRHAAEGAPQMEQHGPTDRARSRDAPFRHTRADKGRKKWSFNNQHFFSRNSFPPGAFAPRALPLLSPGRQPFAVRRLAPSGRCAAHPRARP
jgi:hypothetical protein